MKRPCFTLIELLVVFAVIVLIVAISIPVLRNSKLRARTVLCGSNIRQLMFGLSVYETDNQSFPYGFYDNPHIEPPGGFPGNMKFDKLGWWWFNYIPDYPGRNRGQMSILWCPSRRIRDPKLDNVLHGNYGVNQSICRIFDHVDRVREEFVGKPLGGSNIPHPAQSLLIVDSGYSIIGWWHVTDVPPVNLDNSIEDSAYIPGLEINKGRDLWPGKKEDAVDGRHPNKTVNVGFVDGHYSRMKAADLLVEKNGDTYMNRGPLWSPR